MSKTTPGRKIISSLMNADWEKQESNPSDIVDFYYDSSRGDFKIFKKDGSIYNTNVLPELPPELQEKKIAAEEEFRKKYEESTQKALETAEKEIEQASRLDKYRSVSYIENDYEEAEARRIIEKQLGFEVPRVAGAFLAVKIYVRPEDTMEVEGHDGQKRKIYLPSQVTGRDKYTNCVALVLNRGPESYKTGQFHEGIFKRIARFLFPDKFPARERCRIGDWVVIPRNEGTQVNYRGMPIQYIYDDRVYATVQDPSHVTRD